MKLPTDQYFEKYLLLHFGLLLLAVILLGVVCFFLWKQMGLQSVIDESLAKQILNLQNQVFKQQKIDNNGTVNNIVNDTLKLDDNFSNGIMNLYGK